MWRQRTLAAGNIPIILILGFGFQVTHFEPTEEEEAGVVKVGTEATANLTSTLKLELTKALREGGAEPAVRICSERALVLTESVGNRFHVEAKRTTLKWRNPSNRPDSLETEALNQFQRAWDSETELPSHLIQKVRINDRTTFRYYRPLKTGPLCLTCHGDPERMPNNLKEILERRYPDDRAVGYREGELRGVVRIEIPESSLP